MSPKAVRLSVARPALDEAFRLLRKLCKPKRDEEAVLSFDGACLHIECAGMTVAPGATGNWPGQVRIPADFLMMLVKMPPAGDPIEVRIEDGRVHVGSSSIGCKTQSAWSKQLELPMNATFADILALHLQHTPQEIEAAGYSKMVAQAKDSADRKIDRIASQLKDFMVEPEELRTFLYGSMRRKILEGLPPRSK